MADANSYRFVANEWQTTTGGGCGCGGSKAKTAVKIAVNADLILIWTQPLLLRVPGISFSYDFRPNVAILDLTAEDYAHFVTDPRFRKPVPAEYPGLFGMRMRNG